MTSTKFIVKLSRVGARGPQYVSEMGQVGKNYFGAQVSASYGEVHRSGCDRLYPECELHRGINSNQDPGLALKPQLPCTRRKCQNR